ncbi:hypothetical protein CMO91_01930 [Candidatus Woesearchaeota archaeon]|nr:hypothetical protein [Candidatus Woesearchaeota archaeon]
MNLNPEVKEKFPGLHIGVVSITGIDNTKPHDEVAKLVQQEQTKVKSLNIHELVDNPKIKSWQEAYRSFGAKPSKYRCSVENLYRMILEGMTLRSINPVVDIYNYISLKHTIPAGGDDADKVDGEITLTLAKGDESFEQLNSKEQSNPKPGEVIYKDDKEVLCRRWNWRECDKTKMTEATKNAVLVVEGLPPFSKDDIQAISDELAELVTKYCGGESKVEVLS